MHLFVHVLGHQICEDSWGPIISKQIYSKPNIRDKLRIYGRNAKGVSCGDILVEQVPIKLLQLLFSDYWLEKM